MQNNNSKTAIESVLRVSTDFDLELRRLCLLIGILFRNRGNQPVEQPQIVIALSPTNVCEMNGRILSPELIRVYGTYQKGGTQSGWKFVRKDWLSYGRKNGEYAIESIQPLILQPDVWMELKDVQIACDIDHLSAPLQVNAYILAHDQKYPILNPTSISFTM